jgi:hypothetical protein|eukprot:scaffold4877_cov199-Chaetoceros_neogracile.AAC.1
MFYFASKARANARIRRNNQSTTDNGATSPSALTQDETREQKQHNRRSKILTTILHKVRFCQQPAAAEAVAAHIMVVFGSLT